jgi:hypothetical protein
MESSQSVMPSDQEQGGRHMHPNLQVRATEVVAAIARKLADPHDVAATADTAKNMMRLPSGSRRIWRPLALSDGHPGLALLFAELAADDPHHRLRAHEFLSACLTASLPETPRLYHGTVSLAFAAHAAALSFAGYPALLARLDDDVAARIRRKAQTDLDRIGNGGPIGSWQGYDVISGASGLGRHLLARYEVTGGVAVQEALKAVVRTLVAIATAQDTSANGRAVSAWLVNDDVHVGSTAIEAHVNLGLAHGVGGPLALLALAWRAGVRVERHEEAVHHIVALLSRWGAHDAAGPLWPDWIVDARAYPERRVRDAWCYGAAGLARALFLAAVAFGNETWKAESHRALRAAISTAREPAIHDFALCHGWAGLLQIVQRMAADTNDAWYMDRADTLAGRIIDEFDDSVPFGYRYFHPALSLGLNRPGFLEGAAGIALTLHAYATGEPPRTNWDAALLLN